MELHVDDEPEPGAALRLLSQAVDVANDVLAAEEAAGREMYGLVDAVAPGPHGPVARFKECEPAAALRLYLSTLTSTLEELGVAGRLLPVAPQIDDRRTATTPSERSPPCCSFRSTWLDSWPTGAAPRPDHTARGGLTSHTPRLFSNPC